MPSTQTDVIDGVSTSTAVKAPVLFATGANITLSGLQTLVGADGESYNLSTAANRRVLVRAQTDPKQNGIYDASDTTWTRSADFDGNRDARDGTVVRTVGGQTWKLTTDDPVVFGTSNIVFAQVSSEINPLQTFDTIALLQANADPAVNNTVFVAGYYSRNDGGGGTFILSASDTTSADNGGTIIVDALGQRWYRHTDQKRTVDARHFGAVANQVSDQSARFLAALNWLDSASIAGGKLLISGGPFTIGGSGITKSSFDYDLTIEFTAGAKLLAAAGMALPVLNLMTSDPGAAGTAAQKCTLTIIAPDIDCSAGAYSPGVSSCTAISAARWKEFYVYNCNLYGGELPQNANADTGIATVANEYMLVHGGRIRGFADLGIYPSGDNVVGGTVTSDGKVCHVDSVTIQRCNGAIDGKRELSLLKVTNCLIEECRAGVQGNPVTNQAGGTIPYVLGAKRIEVGGTTFRRNLANCVRMRTWVEGFIHDCVFEDWGYEYDATGSVGASAYALNLQGSDAITVKGCQFYLKNWVLDSHRAALVDANVLEEDGNVYQGGNHHFSGNFYRGLFAGVVEETGCLPGLYGVEYVDTVTQPANPAQFNADSLFIYVDAGTGVLTYWRGNQRYEYQVAVATTVIDTDISLAGLGSVAAGATGSTFVAITGVTAATRLTITPKSANLPNLPSINVTYRPVAGGVDISAFNGEAAPFDFVAETVNVHGFRMA